MPLRHLFLSPHLDDVAWSAGGIVAILRARGAAVNVVTSCAGVPPPDRMLPRWMNPPGINTSTAAADVVHTRREEDRVAMGVLDVGFEWEDNLDAVYRRPESYDSLARLMGPVIDGDPLVRSVSTSLDRLDAGTLLHAPLGIGVHVDHRIVSDAVIGAGRPTCFYEDFPYVVDFPGALERRLEGVGRPLEPFVVDVSTVIGKRWEAMRAYASQIGVFADALIAKASAYARSLGGGVESERIWVAAEWLPVVRTAFMLDS